MNSLKSILAVFNKYAVISALAALGMGIILLFATEAVFHIVCVIFGMLLMIPAVMWIYEGVVKGGGILLIVPGVIVALLGAFITFRSNDLASVFGVFFGIFLIIAGLVHVGRSLFDRGVGDSGWLLSLILGVGVSAFGVVCIIKSGAVTMVFMKVYGIAFLIYSVATLLSVWEFNKTVEDVKNEIEHPAIEVTGEETPSGFADEATDAGYADVPDETPEVVETDDSVVEVDGKVVEIINDGEEE